MAKTPPQVGAIAEDNVNILIVALIFSKLIVTVAKMDSNSFPCFSKTLSHQARTRGCIARQRVFSSNTVVFPTAFLVDGAKCDLSSILSPAFQVSHSFAWAGAQPPQYHFGAGYSTPSLLLHGLIDHDANLQARAHYNWLPQHLPEKPVAEEPTPENAEKAPETVMFSATSTSKMQAQIGGQDVLQLEHDHQDTHFSLNFKAVNPDPSMTGIYSASFLKSLTRSLSVGAEVVHQRPSPDMQDTSINYAVRWAPPPAKLSPPPSFPADLAVPFLHVNPRDPTQVLTSTWAPSSGVLQTTYWRRINPRLEVSSELQLLMTPAVEKALGRRGGLASIGFKLETIYATIRSMVDTHGRISTVLEEKIAPGLAFAISGEMDYSQGRGGQGKVGFGFTLEA